MDPGQFIAKWRQVQLSERAAAQQHFLDLCALVGQPPPAEVDPTGETFTFERGAAKHGGGDGWADVWKKGFFGWEYKGRHKDLGAAYDQLLLYREALESPPLLVVCDLDRIVIRTNFTATPSQCYEIPLEALGEPRNLEILHALFFAPDKLRPGRTSEAVTQEAAAVFAGLAGSLRSRGVPADTAAHFLDRIVFCLFAEDIGLLPEGVFSNIVRSAVRNPGLFTDMAGQLFRAMAAGGAFGSDVILHFNGSLFEDASAIELTRDELLEIASVSGLDWSAVDVSIFGTLFERGLDPAKRAQLGAHYTSRQDIELLVEPVIMQPLRREWETVRAAALDRLARAATAGGKKAAPVRGKKTAAARKGSGEAATMVHQFLMRLSSIKVLDPACGSGNFLYVTLQKLKDLEKEVCIFAQDQGIGPFLPAVGPWQLYGIEVNAYAYDLALMTVWIGHLQWMKTNGLWITSDPVLRRLEGNFRNMDAIMDLTDPANPREPEWPRVDFVVSNPPFLGDKLMRRELGNEYVDKLRKLYAGRIPGQSDLCCYWVEKARQHIAAGKCRRAGLLATQGIRGGANRETLKRIKESGSIFWAISDREWVLDGANVHVSMIAFDDGNEKARTLDSRAVASINANLSAGADVTVVKAVPQNKGLCFQGPVKVGAFEIPHSLASSWLLTPNPQGRPTSDVLNLWVNGMDITRRPKEYWIIDFGSASYEEACLFTEPFSYLESKVKPKRVANADRQRRENWWRLGRSGCDWKVAASTLSRAVFTPRVSKHRVFQWFSGSTLPDSAVVGYARADDYFFGVLHSRMHEVWALRMGTRLETRPRYTPTTCFETFPFPWAPGSEPRDDPRVQAIAAAAKALCELRNRWLNPPEWTKEELLEFPGTVGGPWTRFIVNDGSLKAGDVGTVQYRRLVPRDEACATQLAKRTLTNLYNARPTWLANAHRALDEAVCAAYAANFGGTWAADMPETQILEQLLALNLAVTGNAAQDSGKP